MRKLILLFTIVITLQTIHAQKTQSDVFNTNDVVFYGLDFSKARFVGSEGFKNPALLKNSFFNTWNHLLVNERNKYSIEKYFGKMNVEYDISVVEERNQTPKVEDLVINNSYTLPESDVPKMVKKYKTTQKDGIGLAFIVERYSKFAENGTMYVTFFDIKTKEILLQRKMTGKAGGFGFRNYWAATVMNVLKKCKTAYPTWMKGKG